MYQLAFGSPALWLLQQTTTAQPPSIFGNLWMMLAVVAIFYFMIFMPMQKQKKQQQAMLDSLEAGKEVVTSGGIVGTIVNVSPDSLILRIKPDNIKLQVARSAISSVVTPGETQEKK
jgi:preprotein translocase subunit YajC